MVTDADPSEKDRLLRRIQELEAREDSQQKAWRACVRLAEIGQITTGVAHELRNPITVILGFAQQLARHTERFPDLATSAQAIEREALRCNRMVQTILNFARMSDAQKRIENIFKVTESALALVRPLAHVRGVTVQVNAPPLLPEIYINAHRIEQLIVNLCTNALDAMPQGGSLALELRAQPSAGDPQAIELCIHDTGQGISENIRGKIFEPFFTTKERGQGTGLGLSMVRDIVDEHNGRLALSSREGYGTVVLIVLPLGVETINPGPNPTRESLDNAQS